MLKVINWLLAKPSKIKTAKMDEVKKEVNRNSTAVLQFKTKVQCSGDDVASILLQGFNNDR